MDLARSEAKVVLTVYAYATKKLPIKKPKTDEIISYDIYDGN